MKKPVVVCYDLANGQLDIIHQWDWEPSGYELSTMLDYSISQDHGTDNVYYITEIEVPES